MPNASQTLSAFRGANLNVEMFGAVGDGVTDDWAAIRAAVAATIKVNGCLTFPRGRFRVTYDVGDATRTSSTGLFDFSPWFDGSNWQSAHNIEIKFDEGAEIFMDCLLPNGYDAQTHCFYARCRWEDIGGAHTPTVWNGYAVGFHSIRIINPRVVWALGSQRGIGDTLRFTGTKSRATAPYGITVENLYAENAPQVSSIFCGCRKVDVWNVHAKSCYADTVHFNACWEGCSIDGVLSEDCGDDAVGAVTYYPDALTLASGADIDTEVGPFTSPDQFSANNNGLKISNVTKIGGSANAVRVQGGYNVVTDTVVADAHGSSTLGSAYWAGSVLANGTTLAQSSMANVGCRAKNITANNGVQVGVHLVAQGFVGNEGDTWLYNDTGVSGVDVSDCAQLSVWGHDCDGFSVDDWHTDAVRSEFTGVKRITISNPDVRGDIVIRGTAVSGTYETSDMDAMPWHDIHFRGGKVTGAKIALEEIRGFVIDDKITIRNSPDAGFEAIRVSDSGGKVKIVNANRDGVADLAHVPARVIPNRRCQFEFEIDHDATETQAFIEVGGGDVYNVSTDLHLDAMVKHAVVSDPPTWEIQGSTYAPTNLYRRSRTWVNGSWIYENTDDLPLPIVPEITAVAIAGTRTLKIRDAVAVFATGVLSALSAGLSNLAAVFGAREIRFMQFGGDEGSAGVIDYGEIQSDALSIHGKGTLSTNRKVRIYDNAIVNGTVDASGLITAPDVKVTNTTGSQPARLDASKLVKGGKISVTASGDVDVSGLTDGALVKRSGGALASVSAFTADRILGTDGSGGVVTKDVDLANSAHVNVPGSHGDILYNNGGASVAAISFASFEATLKSYFDGIYAPLVHTHAEGDVTNLLSDLGALDSAITGLGSGKADHGTYGVTGGGGGSVSI